jgi:hypothetical protein
MKERQPLTSLPWLKNGRAKGALHIVLEGVRAKHEERNLSIINYAKKKSWKKYFKHKCNDELSILFV